MIPKKKYKLNKYKVHLDNAKCIQNYLTSNKEDQVLVEKYNNYFLIYNHYDYEPYHLNNFIAINENIFNQYYEYQP
jgi:hypothetical protein